MRKTRIQELSLSNFRSYGTFANLLKPDSFHFGEPPIEFYRDMLQLHLGNSSPASISICKVCSRALIIDKSEYHGQTCEGVLPLDGDVIIHAGPATRKGVFPAEHVEAFRLPRLTMVALKPGVWHHAPFAYKSDFVHVLIALPERTYANDCTVLELMEDERIEIGV